jgi:putative transposase
MRVHAYVFMPNHVHLLVTGDLPESISKCVQSLGRRYVAYFNFIHKRTGTLWEGRFFSSVVDTDGYFLACHRYIEMNPVRASLCRHPGEHVWSSYRYYAQVRPDELVTPHAVHASLGIPGPAHARLFETALKAETVDRIRDAVNHGWALGDEPFKAHLAEVAARRTERVKTGRPRKKPELSKLESDPSFS